MTGPKTGSAIGSAIPSSDRKLVQSLKEIVQNSEEEIYAMLKECNMDLNETAQRLLSEDTFHVVKRKREKKKENANNREITDNKSRGGNVGLRGKNSSASERGAGRGSSLPHLSSTELSVGRGKPLPTRENGIYFSSKASTPALANVSHIHQVGQLIGASAGTSSYASASPSTSNGSSSHARPSIRLQGTWVLGSGHATMADILKNGTHSSTPVSTMDAAFPSSVQAPLTPHHYTSPAYSVSEVVSPATNFVPCPLVDPHAPGPADAIKVDVGMIGNQRPIGDRASSLTPSDGNLISTSFSQHTQFSQGSSASSDVDADLKLRHTENSSVVSFLEDQVRGIENTRVLTGAQGDSLGVQDSSGLTDFSTSWAVLASNQLNSVPVYQTQQSPSQQKEVVISPPSSPPQDNVVLSATAAKLRELNLQNEQPVIIPDHLRVSGADYSRLSFGSFGATFPASSSGDSKSACFKNEESILTSDIVIPEQPNSSSVFSTDASSPNEHQPTSPSSVERLVSSSDTSTMLTTRNSNAESDNLEAVVQRSPQHSYIPTVPSYSGLNVVPHLHGGQYSFEQTESRTQDLSRVSRVLEPYSDLATNSFNATARSGPEGDARYPTFLASSLNGKFNYSLPTASGQSINVQESGNSLSASGSFGPTSLSGNTQTAMTVPQQAAPIHAYAAQPSGLPLGSLGNVFGYQYVPPNITYLHSLYQQNYAGNNSYHQGPTGSSYSSGSAPATKYPIPPQYKVVGGGASGLHSTVAVGNVGYGGYTNPQSGTYAVNPTISTGNTTGYDDVVSHQYKDNSLYIPAPQVEPSAMWAHAPFSRETAGIQARSYSNMPGQNPHTAHAHPQPSPAHSYHPSVYSSLYHSQQSGPSQGAHQLLQQPQGLGNGGAGGTQGGSYQQPQRTQQTWVNNF